MGLMLSCLRDDHPAIPNKSCRNNEGNGSSTAHNGWLCGALITRTKKKEQPHVHQLGKQDEDVEFHKCRNKKVLTLEDWILSSPSWNNQVLGGRASSRKKIHPSFDAKTAGSSLKLEEAETGNASSVKKMKKKVSFRSPEVADIFVLDVSPDHAHMIRGQGGTTT